MVFLSSCEDFLYEMPSGSLPSDEAITSVDDLHNALNGVYGEFIDQYAHAGDFTVYGDMKGDDAYYPRNANHSTPLARFDHNSTGVHPFEFWATFYTALGRVNDILEVCENLELGSASQEEFDNYLGQLHALRGFIHFEIAKVYAQLPTVAADINAPHSGIPISDRKFSVDHKPVRSTLKETWNFIIDELAKSVDLLHEAPNNGKINKAAAKGLLSRAYLYYSNYDKALETAHNLITEFSSLYSLYTIDEYTSVWSKTFTSESLWEIGITDVDNAQRNSLGYYTNPDGYAETGVRQNYVDYISQYPEDVRSGLIVEKTNTEGTVTAMFTDKYPGQEGSAMPLYANNPKIIRLAEIYLIAAEAAVKGGQYSEANSAEWYINELRKNRIIDYQETQSVDLDAVLDERRRELSFEGHRFFDLIRNNISFNNEYAGDVSPDQFNVIMAIPQRETDISPELVQNPGY